MVITFQQIKVQQLFHKVILQMPMRQGNIICKSEAKTIMLLFTGLGPGSYDSGKLLGPCLFS